MGAPKIAPTRGQAAADASGSQGPARLVPPVTTASIGNQAAPSIPAILEHLAELASMRATIAQEEARALADLARIGQIAQIGQVGLAGCAAQSVTSTVPHQSPVSAPTASAMLSQRGVAAFLDCCPRTVRRMEQGGELPAPVEVAGLKRWRRVDLEVWVEQAHAAGGTGR